MNAQRQVGTEWIQTFTGRAFYPLNPRAEDVSMVDIAHALAHQCRYAGHTRHFYSVAEHSVLMSYAVPERYAAWALMHDASEAYLVDIPRPIKAAIGPAYTEAEDRLMRCIAQRFGLSWPCPPVVKEYDTRILLNERAALHTTPPQPWGLDVDPLPGLRIYAWDPGYS